MNSICVDPPPELAACSGWYDAYRDIRVYCQPDLLERLSADAPARLKGGESTGVLLGSFSSSSAPQSVILEGIEYAGDSALSDIVRRLREGQGPQPIGYFRIDTRESPAIGPLESYLFSEETSIFLVIRPYRAGLSMAAFFYCPDGLRPEYPDLEFPLIGRTRGRKHAAPEPEVLTTPVEVLTTPVEVPTAPVEVLTAPVEVLTAPVEVLTAPVEVLTAPVGVLTAPVEVLTAPVPESAPPPAWSGWRSRWVGFGAVLGTAVTAGVLSYRLQTPAVTPTAVPVSMPAEHAAPRAQDKGENPAPPPARDATIDRPAAQPPRGQASRTDFPLAAPPPRKALAVSAIARVRPAPAKPELLPPPDVQPALAAALQVPLPVPSPPAGLPLPATPRREPPAASRPAGLPAPVTPRGEPPAAHPAATPGVSPPVLIRQVAPTIRADLRRLVTNDAAFEVVVDIDVRGAVTKAYLRKSDAPFAGLLAPSLIAAALQHRFMPATVGGHEVPSQSIIIFRFGRGR